MEVSDSTIEACASAAHEVKRDRAATDGLAQDPPWSAAPDWMKDSSRALARDVLAGGPGGQGEHERWMAERLAAGWVYGPVKDNAAKTNPLLVAWAELPQSIRDLNDAMVAAVKSTYAALASPSSAVAPKSLGEQLASIPGVRSRENLPLIWTQPERPGSTMRVLNGHAGSFDPVRYKWSVSSVDLGDPSGAAAGTLAVWAREVLKEPLCLARPYRQPKGVILWIIERPQRLTDDWLCEDGTWTRVCQPSTSPVSEPSEAEAWAKAILTHFRGR